MTKSKQTILDYAIESIKHLGIPVHETVALRFRGLGKKRLQQLIAMGYVTSTSRSDRAADIAARAMRVKNQRTEKVRKLITNTEIRLKSLKKELRSLTR
jgi:nucleotidyltransferase/DNA polymerase involved in DNA repair